MQMKLRTAADQLTECQTDRQTDRDNHRDRDRQTNRHIQIYRGELTEGERQTNT